jgi:hypothetical protein
MSFNRILAAPVTGAIDMTSPILSFSVQASLDADYDGNHWRLFAVTNPSSSKSVCFNMRARLDWSGKLEVEPCGYTIHKRTVFTLPLQLGKKVATPQYIMDHLESHGFDKFHFVAQGWYIHGCRFWIVCVVQRLVELDIVQGSSLEDLRSAIDKVFDKSGSVTESKVVPGLFTTGIKKWSGDKAPLNNMNSAILSFLVTARNPDVRGASDWEISAVTKENQSVRFSMGLASPGQLPGEFKVEPCENVKPRWAVFEVPMKVGSKAATPQDIKNHLEEYGFDKFEFTAVRSVRGSRSWVLAVVKRLVDLKIVEHDAYQTLCSVIVKQYDNNGRACRDSPVVHGTFLAGIRPWDEGEGESSTAPQTALQTKRQHLEPPQDHGTASAQQAALPSGQQLGAVQRLVPFPKDPNPVGPPDVDHVGSSQPAAKQRLNLPPPSP